MLNLNKTLLYIFLGFFLFTFSGGDLLSKENKSAPKKSVSIQRFSATNVSSGKAQRLKSVVERTFFESIFYSLKEVNPSDNVMKNLKSRLLELKSKDNLDSAIEMGKLLAVDYVIMGELMNSEDGEKTTLTLKVVSISQKKVILMESTTMDKGDNLKKETGYFTKEVIDKLRDIETSHPYKIYFSVTGNYTAPSGFLSKRAGKGSGIIISGEIRDFIRKNIMIGLDMEYISLDGKSGETHHAVLYPFTLKAGYQFKYHNLSLTPYLGAGYSYNSLFEYTSNSGTDYEEVNNYKPMVKAGLASEFKVNDFLNLHLNCNYSRIFESENLDFYSLGLGLSTRL